MTVDISKIVELANRLEAGFGTDTELGDVIDNLSKDECKLLDTLVFECDVCNHWFRQRDNATPNNARWECKECAGDGDDNDD